MVRCKDTAARNFTANTQFFSHLTFRVLHFGILVKSPLPKETADIRIKGLSLTIYFRTRRSVRDLPSHSKLEYAALTTRLRRLRRESFHDLYKLDGAINDFYGWYIYQSY